MAGPGPDARRGGDGGAPQWTVQRLAEMAAGQLVQGDPARVCFGVSTDTRTLAPGQLFIALTGPRFDGHQFVHEAVLKGAAAVLVNPQRVTHPVPLPAPVIAVEDPLAALGRLAHAHRRAHPVPLIAVTGSCGKTTTKDLIALLLGLRYHVLKSEGTQNNAIGLPLTLLRLTAAHEVIVAELGSNHPGEIAALAAIAEPSCAVITNIGPAHLEHFGTVEGVAEEKLSLLDALPSGGQAVINADDAAMQAWLARHQTAGAQFRILTYGEGESAEFPVHHVHPSATGVTFEIKGIGTFGVHLLGRHNAMNAAAAVVCGVLFGLATPLMRYQLGLARAADRRLERVTLPNGTIIVSDCYNANPVSMAAAFEVLKTVRPGVGKIAVCGDMLELGAEAERWHEQVGELASQAGVDLLLAVGRFAPAVVRGACRGAASSCVAVACPTMEAAQQQLARIPLERQVILVKGSRGMALERIVEWLKQPRHSNHASRITHHGSS